LKFKQAHKYFESFSQKLFLSLFVCLIYLVLGALSRNLATFGGHLAVFWPATGLGIGLMIRFGVGILPAIFIGSLLADKGLHFQGLFAFISASGSLVEAYVGARLFVYVRKQNRFLMSYSKSTAYFLSSLVAPIFSASIFTILNYYSNFEKFDGLMTNWLEYWSGNGLGCFIFLPIFFEVLKLFRARKLLKALQAYHNTLLVLFFSIGLVLAANFLFHDHAVLWLICPLIFLTGKRIGRIGTYLTVLLTSLVLISISYRFEGPFENGSIVLNIIYLQCLLSSFGWASLLSDQLKHSESKNIGNIIFLNSFVWLAAVLVVGLMSQVEKQHSRAEYQNIVDTAIDHLQQVETSVGSYLLSASAHFSVNPKTTPQEWRQFSQTLKNDKYPVAINGLGFIDYFDHLDSQNFQIKKLAESRTQKKIRVLDPKYANRFHNKYVIDLIEPIENNRAALGLDIGSERNRREAAEKAKDLRSVVATRPIQLVQDSVERPGFLVYSPTWFSKSTNSKSIFLGWAYAPVIFEYFFDEAFSGYLSDLTLKITLDDNLIYSSIERHPAEFNSKYLFSKDLYIYSLPIKVNFYPTTDFFLENNQLTSVSLATLLTIILLISTLFLNEKGQYSRRLQNEVEVQTRNLAQSEEYVKSLIELAPTGIATLDSNFHFLSMNKELLSFIGYSAEEMRNKSIESILYPDDLQQNFEFSNQGQDNLPKFSKQQKRYVRKDGTIVWGELTTAQIMAHGSIHPTVLVILKDINDVKELERITFDQRSQIDQLYNALNSSALVLKTNVKGIITYVNDKITHVSQFSSSELLGIEIQILTSGTRTDEFFREIYITLSQGIIWNGDHNFFKKNGTSYWVNANISPVFNDQGFISEYLFILFDITAQKEAELSLQHSAKMSSLGEMAGGIAHEINNPLAIIQGKSSQLRRLIDSGNVTTEIAKDFLSKIESTTERISKIVKGLRMFSRDTSKVQFTQNSVTQIIEETLVLCGERLHQHGITVTSKIPEDAFITCNPTQISQVLLNLLNNAHDAVFKTPYPWIRVEVEKQMDQVLISVIDSGQGIPPEIVDKIMQPFFTTKPVGVGTGLGLSISLGIIKAHYGEFKIDLKNPNTCFVIQLPTVN
jgi:PAS domain S-box-containing protein